MDTQELSVFELSRGPGVRMVTWELSLCKLSHGPSVRMVTWELSQCPSYVWTHWNCSQKHGSYASIHSAKCCVLPLMSILSW